MIKCERNMIVKRLFRAYTEKFAVQLVISLN